MIGLCTDSSALVPDELVQRYGLVVVPLTVELDGDEHLDGAGLDADRFYASFGAGRRPVVTITQPSPGQFAVAYEELVDRGCRAVLSIHSGRRHPGMLTSARLATRGASVPVRVVDTGAEAFGIGCGVWAAGEALAAGATAEQAAQAAERASADAAQVFTVASFELLAGLPAGERVPLIASRDGRMTPSAAAGDRCEAVEWMVGRVVAGGAGLRVGIGTADRAGTELADELVAVLSGNPAVDEVVRFRLGPSGAHHGPGTTTAHWFRSPAA